MQFINNVEVRLGPEAAGKLQKQVAQASMSSITYGYIGGFLLSEEKEKRSNIIYGWVDFLCGLKLKADCSGVTLKESCEGKSSQWKDL